VTVTDLLFFTHNIDVSDYYTLDTPTTSAQMSDGHRFDDTYAPVYTRGSTTTFTAGTYPYLLNTVTGKTDINFTLSSMFATIVGPASFSVFLLRFLLLMN